MEPQRYKKTKILLLLLLISLLLHLIMSFFFLEFGFQKRFTSFIKVLSNAMANLPDKDKRKIEEKRERKRDTLQKIFETARKNKKNIIKPDIFKTKLKDDRQAKLVAPISNFGWVMFDDNYKKPTKLEIPTNKTGDVMKVKLPNATETKPKILEHKIKPPQIKDVIEPEDMPKKQKSTEIKPKSLPDKNKIIENKIVEEKVQEKKEEIKKDEYIKKELNVADKKIFEPEKQISQLAQIETHEQKTQVDDRIKKIREMQEAVTQYQKSANTKEQEREGLLSSILKKDKKNKATVIDQEKKTEFAWGASSLKTRQPKNIIALTKGYIEKTQGENGTDLIDRDGDPNKIPSFEEMKYISYESKLNWCCQATWKQNSNFYNLPVASKDYQAVIEFSIDLKGNLVNVEILESSGCKEVDSAIVKNLKATAPFPPLPKHFGKDIYTTGKIITVSINRMLF